MEKNTKLKRKQKNMSLMIEAINKIKRLSAESSLTESQIVERAIAKLSSEDLFLDFSK